jgi:hypothetical protein
MPALMAQESWSTSSLAESQHPLDAKKQQNNEIDVEMGSSNSGALWDYTHSGL